MLKSGDTSLENKALLFLEPGFYDVKMINSSTKKEIFLSNIEVTDSEKTVKEVKFAQTTLKLICKNEMNKINNLCDVYVYDKNNVEIKYVDTSMGYAEFVLDSGVYDIKVEEYESKEIKWLKDFDMTMGGKITKEIKFN